MDLGLSDRVIVVTGGAAGIGQAITRICLTENAFVVTVGRQSPAAVLFQDEMRDHPRYRFIVAELAEVDQCRAAIDLITEQYGRLDDLVNNAGANDGISLASGDPMRFMESLRQNLLHYYSMTHYALPLLKVARGSIVNVSSKVAMTGQGGTSGYAAAKGAQLALTREWAAELLPFGVRVNSVMPAEVMTPLYQSWIASQDRGDEALARITQRIPLGQRMTTAHEVAATVAFLLSPLQSGHTTAQHLVVDGGYVHLDRALT